MRLSTFLLASFSIAVLVYLVVPILLIVPISLNADAYFAFPPDQYSFRWYQAFANDGQWLVALGRSFLVGIGAATLATVLGLLAAIGISRSSQWVEAIAVPFFMAPLIVPVVVFAAGSYFMLSSMRMTGTYLGMVVMHAVLGLPYVVLVVVSALKRFDRNLERAALVCGASPIRVLQRVTIPILLPSVATGALFAFITSFDEVVMGLFIAGQNWRTLPVMLFQGIELEVTPIITVVASLLLFVTIAILATFYFARRGSLVKIT